MHVEHQPQRAKTDGADAVEHDGFCVDGASGFAQQRRKIQDDRGDRGGVARGRRRQVAPAVARGAHGGAMLGRGGNQAGQRNTTRAAERRLLNALQQRRQQRGFTGRHLARRQRQHEHADRAQWRFQDQIERDARRACAGRTSRATRRTARRA